MARVPGAAVGEAVVRPEAHPAAALTVLPVPARDRPEPVSSTGTDSEAWSLAGDGTVIPCSVCFQKWEEGQWCTHLSASGGHGLGSLLSPADRALGTLRHQLYPCGHSHRGASAPWLGWPCCHQGGWMAGAVDTVLLLQVVMNPQLSVEPAHRGRDGGEAEGSQPPPTTSPHLGEDRWSGA